MEKCDKDPLVTIKDLGDKRSLMQAQLFDLSPSLRASYFLYCESKDISNQSAKLLMSGETRLDS